MAMKMHGVDKVMKEMQWQEHFATTVYQGTSNHMTTPAWNPPEFNSQTHPLPAKQIPFSLPILVKFCPSVVWERQAHFLLLREPHSPQLGPPPQF